jgi:hypothetical protein
MKKVKQVVIDPRISFPTYPYDKDNIVVKTICAWKTIADCKFTDDTISVDPKTLVAGYIHDLTFTYKVINKPILKGGTVKLSMPHTWTPPTPEPGKPGSIEVVTSNGAQTKIEVFEFSLLEWYANITLVDKELPAGECMQIKYNKVKIQTIPQNIWNDWRSVCIVYVDKNGTGEYELIKHENRYYLDIKPSPAYKFRVIAKPLIGPDNKNIIKVRSLDCYNNLPLNPYTGELILHENNPYDIITTHAVKESDNGRAWVNIKDTNKHLHYIRVLSKDSMICGTSNPSIKKTGRFQGYNVYFGDTHAKTSMSDGLGTPDDYYNHAKNTAGSDFAAIADHDSREHSRIDGPIFYDRMRQEAFDQIQNAGDRWNKPGEFATIIASEEMFGDGGHRNIYYRGSGQKLFPPGTIPDLWNFLDKQGKECIVIPHHMMIWKSHMRDHNPKYEKVFEIYSMHCSDEYKGTPLCNKEQSGISAQEMLAAGMRLGFIASSDNHHGQPDMSSRPSRFSNLVYPNGIAAVFSKKLTREGIYDSLKARQCYGTTGERIIIWFEINGEMMGSEIRLKANKTPRKIRMYAAGTDLIDKIELIRNNKTVYEVRNPLSFEYDVEWVDKTLVKNTVFYYMRVTQKDGAMAWSSPIWVE